MSNSGISEMLSKLSAETGVSEAELMRFAGLIARQETESTGMDPASVQGGYGQGRGMFQFESPFYVKEGGKVPKNSVKTAVNRLKNFYKASDLNAPEWVKGLSEKTDPTTLTAEQQYMLFFADKMPTANVVNPITKKQELRFANSPLSQIATETFNPVEWWAKYHKRATPSANDTTRFNRILSDYASTSPAATQQAALQPMQFAQLTGDTMSDAPQAGYGQVIAPIGKTVQDAEMDALERDFRNRAAQARGEQPRFENVDYDPGLFDSLSNWMFRR